MAVWPLATVWLPEPAAAAVKSNPAPDKGSVASAANALDAMFNVPDNGPVLNGANAMLAVQLPAAGSDAPQVCPLSLKPALVENARLSRETVALVLEMVMVDGLLVAPTPVAGKLSCAGDS